MAPDYINSMYSMYNCEAYSLRNSIHNNILNVPLPRLEIFKWAPSYKAPTDIPTGTFFQITLEIPTH